MIKIRNSNISKCRNNNWSNKWNNNVQMHDCLQSMFQCFLKDYACPTKTNLIQSLWDGPGVPDIKRRIAECHRNNEKSNNCYVVDITSVGESTCDAVECKDCTGKNQSLSNFIQILFLEIHYQWRVNPNWSILGRFTCLILGEESGRDIWWKISKPVGENFSSFWFGPVFTIWLTVDIESITNSLVEDLMLSTMIIWIHVWSNKVIRG